MTILMIGSRAESLRALASEPDNRMLSIEDELARTARRMRRGTAVPSPPSGEFTFREYKPFPVAHLPDVKPGEPQALVLLHRLAADPGIVHIMNEHRCVAPWCSASNEPCLRC
jgi:hypothetical protein